MDRLSLALGENSYNILFSDSFDGLADALSKIAAPKKLLIVSDVNVGVLYAKKVTEILSSAGYDVSLHIFPAGEKHKHMQTVLDICRACIRCGMDRNSMILALGGGVVGDIAGFAAAIYMRGIRFVQIPTTLLSQSDSSVGGKTGVDFAESKNILGAFHQPKLVYINVSVLKTLPEREFISGMGEVIKHGIIYDGEFFKYLADNADRIKGLEADTLIRMSKKNCGIKADVVMQDEKESGLRAILNFGHTIGHAVESAFGFSKTHGECVGLGMCAACSIALGRGMISPENFNEVRSLLGLYNMPVSAEISNFDRIYSFMQNDKKKSNGNLRFILPDRIGHVIIADDISKDEIYAALEKIKNK